MYFIFKSIKLFSILFIVLSLHTVVGQVIQYTPKKAELKPVIVNKPITVSLITEKSSGTSQASSKKQIPQKKKAKKYSKKKLKKRKKTQRKRKRIRKNSKKVSKKIKSNNVNGTVSNKNVISAANNTQVNETTQQNTGNAGTKNKVGNGDKAKKSTKKAVKFVAPSYKASYLHNPKPKYPRISKRRGEEGKVLLSVKVSKSGTASSVSIKKSSGYTRLDNSARNAVKNWRFVPAKKNGKAVSGWVVVPINFDLK